MIFNSSIARVVLLCASFCLIAIDARAADGEPPPIRNFDIKTIERLGREMYEQDQWAWKATDFVLAQRGEAGAANDGIRGWVTGRIDGKPRVRFIRVVNDKPEALYDVTFNGDDMSFSTPASRVLSAEEAAQYSARMLAIESAGNACSDSYNTIVLKDPEGDGWLVWALAATRTDPNAVILGGHYRLTISADGKTIKRRDALSRSCIVFPRNNPDAPPDAKEVGLHVSHVVSLTPVETHVFASLSYKLTIFIGTRDGRAWKASEGSLQTLEMDDPDLDGYSARVIAGMNETCRTVAETPDGKFAVFGELQVILPTETGEGLKVQVPPGHKAVGVACSRSDIIPAPNDYRVLIAGYRLYISDDGVGHPERMGVLELVDGHLRFRMTDGENLTPALLARLEKRLDQMQTAMQE